MVNIELSTTLLIIISVIILLLIVAGIVFIIYKDKMSDEKEIDEILDDLVKAKPRKKEEKLINAKIEIPIGEVKKSKKELVEDGKLDLESMLGRMQENLDTKEEVVDNFEKEQEEKAIISYQELVNNLNKDDYKNEIDVYEEEQEKSFEEITKEKVKEFLTKEEPIRKIESPLEEKNKKFKTTDFISPIFGKMNSKIEYPTIKLFNSKDELMDEIENYKHAKVAEQPEYVSSIVTEDKNDEFLKSLKEFRNNL